MCFARVSGTTTACTQVHLDVSLDMHPDHSRPDNCKRLRMNTSRQIRKLETALKRLNPHSPRVFGAALCISVPLLLVVLVYSTMAPIINDVTTNCNDPVEFTQKAKLNPFPESFKEQVKTGYPDLKPLSVRLATFPPYSGTAVSAVNVPHQQHNFGTATSVYWLRLMS